MEKVRAMALKYAIKNAYSHGGKADVGAVIGKMKALFPDLDIAKAMPHISGAVKEANEMKKEQLEKKFLEFEKEGWELKHVEKEKTLPELEWIGKEKLVTRVAPNPSGAMHLGHARPAILTDEYVKKYGGKYILRFDDTDPKIKVPVAGIEKEFLGEFRWLGIKIDETANASDNLKEYYNVVEELIKKGKAYVCFCEAEEWRKLISKSKECPCRKKDEKEQMEEWKKMLTHEIKEGEAVVRIKTDLKNKDPSVRDWWLAKVVDAVEHPNREAAKMHVWPSYNLASSVDDHRMEINFIIRGQEHAQNETKQRYLYEYMKWKYPHALYHGKLAKVGDMLLSKSKISELMKKGSITSDDDPRLATLKALRRRGFTPQAIRKIIVDMGVNPSEAKVSMENFAAANKSVLGNVAEFPFFEEAVEVEAYNVGNGAGECYGEKIEFEGPIEKFLVDKKELKRHKAGEIIRFKKAFNVKLDEVSEYGGKATFSSYSKADANYPIVSWLENQVDVELLMSDGTKKMGFTAPSILEASGVIHFEGVGYANIEAKSEGMVKCVFSYE
ncbi:MAG: glutamate--tRNA ligase [Candidatus Diapherotrites archaeon]|nr:glutamate--tRNA ligase [Candidatus Diapherotrites archaeon]